MNVLDPFFDRTRQPKQPPPSSAMIFPHNGRGVGVGVGGRCGGAGRGTAAAAGAAVLPDASQLAQLQSSSQSRAELLSIAALGGLLGSADDDDGGAPAGGGFVKAEAAKERASPKAPHAAAANANGAPGLSAGPSGPPAIDEAHLLSQLTRSSSSSLPKKKKKAAPPAAALAAATFDLGMGLAAFSSAHLDLGGPPESGSGPPPSGSGGGDDDDDDDAGNGGSSAAALVDLTASDTNDNDASSRRLLPSSPASPWGDEWDKFQRQQRDLLRGGGRRRRQQGRNEERREGIGWGLGQSLGGSVVEPVDAAPPQARRNNGHGGDDDDDDEGRRIDDMIRPLLSGTAGGVGVGVGVPPGPPADAGGADAGQDLLRRGTADLLLKGAAFQSAATAALLSALLKTTPPPADVLGGAAAGAGANTSSLENFLRASNPKTVGGGAAAAALGAGHSALLTPPPPPPPDALAPTEILGGANTDSLENFLRAASAGALPTADAALPINVKSDGGIGVPAAITAVRGAVPTPSPLPSPSLPEKRRASPGGGGSGGSGLNSGGAAAASALDDELIRGLLRLHSEAGTVPNDDGFLPIHLACLHFPCNAKLIGTMLCTNPDVARRRVAAKAAKARRRRRSSMSARRGAAGPEDDDDDDDPSRPSKRSKFLNFRGVVAFPKRAPAGTSSSSASEGGTGGGASGGANGNGGGNGNAFGAVDPYDGACPLHVALANGASLPAVRLLVRQAPDVLTLKNAAGHVPLSAALRSGKCDDDVLLFLAGACPAAAGTPDGRMNTPLHYACMSRGGGGGIGGVSGGGKGSGCGGGSGGGGGGGGKGAARRRYRPPGMAVLRALAEARPEGLLRRNFNGRTPLDLAQSSGNARRFGDEEISYLHEVAYREDAGAVEEAPDV